MRIFRLFVFFVRGNTKPPVIQQFIKKKKKMVLSEVGQTTCQRPVNIDPSPITKNKKNKVSLVIGIQIPRISPLWSTTPLSVAFPIYPHCPLRAAKIAKLSLKTGDFLLSITKQKKKNFSPLLLPQPINSLDRPLSVVFSSSWCLGRRVHFQLASFSNKGCVKFKKKTKQKKEEKRHKINGVWHTIYEKKKEKRNKRKWRSSSSGVSTYTSFQRRIELGQQY